jgi:tetratricopeptide (TPR) repeat protein
VDAAEGRPEAAAKGTGPEAFVAANRALAAWASGRTPEDVDVQALASAFPGWWGVSLAEAERALASGDERAAAEKLGSALDACDARAGAPAVSAPGAVAAILGGSGSPSLCARAQRLAGATFVRASLRALAETKSKGSAVGARDARAFAERALKLPIDAAARAVALFVRGTADLELGNAAGAREGLTAALAAKLQPALASMARNNLGVALARSGAADEATKELSAARAASPAPPEAALNLALRLDETGRSAEALALYDEYLRSGASREDIVQRAEALRKVLR